MREGVWGRIMVDTQPVIREGSNKLYGGLFNSLSIPAICVHCTAIVRFGKVL